MKDEFKRLMSLLTQHQDGKGVNLNELLRASTAFFKDLQTSFLTADQADKKEILHMVNEMYAAMAAQAREISKTTGMSQDDIAEYVQNPDNFTPEQWKMLQETREKISSSSKEISEYLRSLAEAGAAAQPENLKENSETQTPKKKSTARTKRDKWMKT